MAPQTRTMRLRTKLSLWLAGSLVLAGGLTTTSIVIRPPRPAVTTPTTTPATAPADRPKRSSRQAAADSLAGLMLLFGLVSLMAAIVCGVWLVVEIRRSRPAWMTQTKYPRRR